MARQRTERRWARWTGGCWGALAAMMASAHAEAVDLASLQTWAQSVVSIEAAGGDAGRAVSGVVVADDGTIATSWHGLRGAAKARVRTHDGQLLEVLGVAAACPGKDLVLLAVKRGDRPLSPAKLVERPVRIGEPVHAIGGPASAPLIAATDELTAVESGERYRRSGPLRESSQVDDDQCRLVHHAFLNRASVGGGLVSDQGELLGVLVAARDWTDRVHVATHAGHVRVLLAKRGAPRPLASFRGDAGESAGGKRGAEFEIEDAEFARDEHLPPLDCDSVRGGESLRRQLAELRRRLAEIPAERKRTAERGEAWRKEALAPQQGYEQVQQRIAFNRLTLTSMVPEMIVPVSATTPARPGDRVTVQTERRFSPRQVNQRLQLDRELLGLNLQLAALDAERLRWRSRAAQTEADDAALERYQSQLLVRAFFLGDPLGMRSEAEVEDSLQELDDEIDQGGANGAFLLARGLIRTRLRRWDEALADFDQVIEDDRTWKGGAEVARARTVARRGGAAPPELPPQVGRAAREDAVLATLLARCALDAGDDAATVRWLKTAWEAGGDRVELERAMALAYLAAPGSGRDLRQAGEYARRCVRRTLGQDWRAWGAVSLVDATRGRWEAAEDTLRRAESLAADFGRDTCRSWQAELREHRLPQERFAP